MKVLKPHTGHMYLSDDIYLVLFASLDVTEYVCLNFLSKIFNVSLQRCRNSFQIPRFVDQCLQIKPEPHSLLKSLIPLETLVLLTYHLPHASSVYHNHITSICQGLGGDWCLCRCRVMRSGSVRRPGWE